MNEILDKVINKHSHEFDIIVERINAYLDSTHSNNEISEESHLITIDCANAFANMAEICFDYGKFKDQWEYGKFHLNIYGPTLLINSQKTSCQYKIGLDRDGICLSTDLRFNQNLRYMDDEFWSCLLELSSFEGFKYEEIEFTPDSQRKKHPELFKTNKSVIYRVLRKYFFDQTDDSYYSRPDSCSVGEFSIILNGSYDFDFLMGQFCKAFKLMYLLNYKLWKVSDLKK